MTALFDNLGNLSKVASQYTGTYQAFANDLAVVSTELASDNADIGSALSNLQQVLGSLAEFIRTNGHALGSSVKGLEAFAGAVAAKQQQLAQVFSGLPIALDNITQAVRPECSRRYCPSVEPRPDERLGELRQVGLRERSSPAAALVG